MIAFLLSIVLAPAPTASPSLRLDAYGDRLPAGAVARFGTVRWRCPDPPEHLIWSPDGKFLVATHGGKCLTIWSYPSGIVTGRFQVPELLRDGRPEFDRSYLPAAITAEQVRFCPDSRSMLVYAGENQLYRLQLPDARWDRIASSSHRGIAVAISADGAKILIETPDNRRPKGEAGGKLSVVQLTRPGHHLDLINRSIQRFLGGGLGRPHFQFACDTVMSPDGRFVATGYLDGEQDKVAVFDLAANRRWILTGEHHERVMFGPESRSLFTIGERLSRWDFTVDDESNRTKLTLTASVEFPKSLDKCEITALSFAAYPSRLVAIGDNKFAQKGRHSRTVSVLNAASLRELKSWDVESPEDLRWRPVPELGVGFGTLPENPGLAVHPDGRTLAVVCPESPLIRFFNLETGKEHHGYGGHNGAVTALVSPASGLRLISASADRVGRVWSLERVRNQAGPGGRGIARPESVRESEVHGRLEDGDLPKPVPSRFKILYDGARHRMELRKADSDELVRVYEEDSFAAAAEADRPKSLPDAISASEEWFAYAVQDRVVVRAVDSGQVLATFRVPGSTPTAVASIPGTDLLAVGYHDGQILIWDLLPCDTPRIVPTAKEYERLFADLGRDVRFSTRARAVLLAFPTATVAALRDLARPFPRPTDFDIDSWIVRLTHPRHIERERAAHELTRHFEVAETAMREVLASTRSLEMEERLRRILDRRTDPIADADELRLTRAAAILERIGTPDAKKELFRLARGGGQPADRAADALVRMREREKGWATLRPMGVKWW